MFQKDFYSKRKNHFCPSSPWWAKWARLARSASSSGCCACARSRATATARAGWAGGPRPRRLWPLRSRSRSGEDAAEGRGLRESRAWGLWHSRPPFQQENWTSSWFLTIWAKNNNCSFIFVNYGLSTHKKVISDVDFWQNVFLEKVAKKLRESNYSLFVNA